MGDIIRLLPDHVANQIAAGEVVQRPASVVKELLENAVDCGATKINLHVHKAGKEQILVQDNGLGMSTTDLRMAFERHATSKIKSTQDIFNIQTKGFRGEALASIAAVAQVEATSKQEDSDLGNKLRIAGNEVSEQLPTAANSGTSISVRNLFFNVPARRNFLKSDAVEMRHIQDEFIRVALAHENIRFELQHNGSELYVLNKGSFKSRIVQIFGKKFNSAIVPINEETDLVKISGFIGKPELAKKSRGEQFFFVNGRFVKSGYLHKAVLNAFEGLLPNKQHPSYFLRLELSPEKIDINIHPSKTEIKFSDEFAIFAVIRTAIKHALGQYNVVPALDFDQNPDWAFMPKQPAKNISQPKIKINPNFNPFEDFASQNTPSTSFAPPPREATQINFEDDSIEATNLFPSESRSPSESLLWNNQYIVFPYKEDLLLIDPFRAHHRLLYEKLLKQESTIVSQQLLFPVDLELEKQQEQAFEKHEAEFLEMGFDFRISDQKLSVLAIPQDWQATDIPEILEQLRSRFETDDKSMGKRKLAAIMAKTAAKNKGVNLNTSEQHYLANELLKLEQAHLSPMGKTIFIRIPLSDIQKKFD